MNRKLSCLFFAALGACTLDPGAGTADLSVPLAANCEYLDPSDKRFIACKGSFKEGGASVLCSPGYTTQVPDLPAALSSACLNYQGKNNFFAADVPAWNDPLAPFTQMSCAQNASWLHGLMGCGGSANATTTLTCKGWPVEIICSKTTDWKCADNLYGAANSNPQSGVICFSANP